MTRFIMRLLGHKLMHRTMAKHTTQGGALDVQLGFALLRDKRVPLASKAVALAMGAGTMVIVQIMELPLQALIALLLPLFGLAFDFALDGLEAVAIPVIVASLLLPRVAPASIVQIIREERLTRMPPMGITG